MDKKGILYGLAAYSLWGILPIYWKALQGVPAFEILMHRMVWSLLFLVLILLYLRRLEWIKTVMRQPRTLALYTAAALLLSVNWGVYIWGVNNNFVIETSLGYFINPLVNVALGMIVFKETLRPGQWAAIGIATLGVGYLTITYGRLPWIALTLAFSFGFYGVLKKMAPLGSFEGLTLETAVLCPPALAYLIYLEWIGAGTFGHTAPLQTTLLAMAGVTTAVPLLFFAAAAPRIPLSMIGILQYLAPTLQFMLGVFLYNEPFSTNRLIGFLLIWSALGIYTIENLVTRRRRKRPVTTTVPPEVQS